MLTPHYRLAYIPTGSYSGGNGQRVINDQRDTIHTLIISLSPLFGILVRTIDKPGNLSNKKNEFLYYID
jgi:hypothetical protein